ncbi:hypothetical protein PENTCL1PPCAC_8624, partial [Pristionchus entomophagus]
GGGQDKEVKLSPSKIPDLSQYNAFTFEKDSIRVHRSFVEKAGGALSEDNFWSRVGDPRVKEHHPVDGEEEEKEERDVCEDRNSKKCKEQRALISSLYRCPIESCSQEFLSEKNLEHHLLKPKTSRICKVVDDAYLAVVEDNANGVRQPMGWALTKRRISRRFPKIVKDFLRKLYDE